MKRKLLVTLVVVVVFLLPLTAQKKVGVDEVVYRRSSLHTMVIESGEMLKGDLVMSSYNLAPFPEKYNDHRLEIKTFDATKYAPGAVEKMQVGGDPKELEKKQKKAEQELPGQIASYFAEAGVAKQMVAKWFNRQEDGSFDMSLIHDRGSYNASEMEAAIASGSIRGMASLKDAGEELIKNTFVVVNRMRFVENELAARITRDIALVAASQIPNDIARTITETAAKVAYEATKDGYSVWTISYLFQLEWNDDIANQFYEEMWVDKSNIDPAVVAKFDETDIFKINYVGFEKAKSIVLISAGKSERQIIQQATIRNVDKVYTKLQKAYDVFKTKTPIKSVEKGVFAQIGMKEGVEGGDKFAVLEQRMNKDGLTEYKQIGIVKADKKLLWDNRYYVDGAEDEADKKEKDSGAKELGGTNFKGKGNYEPGMLLRQVK